MHSFSRYCFDKEAIANSKTLKNFMAVLFKQSNQPEALIPYHEHNANKNATDEDELKIKAPKYFGAGGEFLSEVYFKTFGHHYNVNGAIYVDDAEHSGNDGGVDATGASSKKELYKLGSIQTLTKPGSPVYIQVKTALNPNREFTTNDGSRIMNFYGHGQGLARVSGCNNTARFLLWTTGKGLHWKLNDNTMKQIEVINFKEISKKIDNNPVFWNNVREAFGLPLVEISCEADAEFISMMEEISLME